MQKHAPIPVMQQSLTSGRQPFQMIGRIPAISKTELSEPLALETAPGSLTVSRIFLTPPQTLSIP